MEVMFLRCPTGLNVDALKATVAAIDQHHDAFALRYRKTEDGWRQWYAGLGQGIGFDRVDASEMKGEALARLREGLKQRFATEINIESGPLALLILLDRGDTGGSLIAAAFHHLVVDAISLSVLAMQLQQGYANVLHGRPAISRPAGFRYTQWLKAMGDYASLPATLDQAEYWQQVCGPSGSDSDRIESGSDPVWRLAPGGKLTAAESRALLARFGSSEQRSGVFIAALASAWREVTSEDDLLVLLEGHGRMNPAGTDTAAAVGWLVCHYPVRNSIADRTLDEYVEAVLEDLRNVPDLGVGYGLLGLDKGRAGERMAGLRKPAAFLQYRGGVDETFRKGVTFPVIGVNHEIQSWWKAQDHHNPGACIRLVAATRGDVVTWQLSYRLRFSEPMALALSDQLGEYLRKLL